MEEKTLKPQLIERIEGSKDLEVKTPESQLNVTIITNDSEQRFDSFLCNTGREFPQWFSTRQITSSPLPNALSPNPPQVNQLQSFHDFDAFVDFDESDCMDNLKQFTPLYPRSRLGFGNAQLLIRSFSNFHKITDACQADLLKLLDAVAPHPNSLPTAYRMVQDGKMNLHNLTTQTVSGPKSQTCVLQVTELLKGFAQRNILNIIRYNIRRCLNEVSDLPVDFLHTAEERDEFRIDLILSTDGVTFVNSSTSHPMYPVWLAVAQLPPILRNSKKNIALAALFVGKGKPNWKEIVRILKQELKRVVTVTMPSSKKFFLKFNVVLIVADLIAKPQLLNMYQHNGYYGCQYCTHPSVTYGSSHSYYPLSIMVDEKVQRIKCAIREPCLHLKYVEKAESLLCNGEENVNVVGVKGRSVFSSLVPGLPLTAPIDYMHCVLIGVYASLLVRHLKLISKNEKRS